MNDFVIDPPIRILGRRGSFVRSTREAAAFMREHMDDNAAKVLRRLERAKSTKEAQEAAKSVSELDSPLVERGLRSNRRGGKS